MALSSKIAQAEVVPVGFRPRKSEMCRTPADHQHDTSSYKIASGLSGVGPLQKNPG